LYVTNKLDFENFGAGAVTRLPSAHPLVSGLDVGINTKLVTKKYHK